MRFYIYVYINAWLMLRTLKIGLHKYVIIFLMKTFLEGGGGHLLEGTI